MVGTALARRSEQALVPEISGVLVDLRLVRRQRFRRIAINAGITAAAVGSLFVSPFLWQLLFATAVGSWLELAVPRLAPPRLRRITEMIGAGLLDDAAAGLDNVDARTREREAATIQLLRGLIAWRRGVLEGALGSFEEGTRHPVRRSVDRVRVRLLAVWLRLELDRLDEARQEIEAIARASPAWRADRQLDVMRLAVAFYARDPVDAAQLARWLRKGDRERRDVKHVALLAWASEQCHDETRGAALLHEVRGADPTALQGLRVMFPRLFTWLEPRLAAP